MPQMTRHGNHRRFKDIRRELGMSQKQLAQALGVKANTVYRWEKGIMPMPLTAELATEHILLTKLLTDMGYI